MSDKSLTNSSRFSAEDSLLENEKSGLSMWRTSLTPGGKGNNILLLVAAVPSLYEQPKVRSIKQNCETLSKSYPILTKSCSTMCVLWRMTFTTSRCLSSSDVGVLFASVGASSLLTDFPSWVIKPLRSKQSFMWVTLISICVDVWRDISKGISTANKRGGGLCVCCVYFKQPIIYWLAPTLRHFRSGETNMGIHSGCFRFFSVFSALYNSISTSSLWVCTQPTQVALCVRNF